MIANESIEKFYSKHDKRRLLYEKNCCAAAIERLNLERARLYWNEGELAWAQYYWQNERINEIHRKRRT